MPELKPEVTPEQQTEVRAEALKEEQFKAKMASDLADIVKMPGWVHVSSTLPQVLKRECMMVDKTSESFKFGYSLGVDEIVRQIQFHAAKKDEYASNVVKASAE